MCLQDFVRKYFSKFKNATIESYHLLDVLQIDELEIKMIDLLDVSWLFINEFYWIFESKGIQISF